MQKKKPTVTQSVPEMKTVLGVLVAQYNEEIMTVTRHETDLAYLRYAEIAEPSVTKHVTDRRDVEKALKVRSKLLEIIRGRILEIEKENDGKEN